MLKSRSAHPSAGIPNEDLDLTSRDLRELLGPGLEAEMCQEPSGRGGVLSRRRHGEAPDAAKERSIRRSLRSDSSGSRRLEGAPAVEEPLETMNQRGSITIVLPNSSPCDL